MFCSNCPKYSSVLFERVNKSIYILRFTFNTNETAFLSKKIIILGPKDYQLQDEESICHLRLTYPKTYVISIGNTKLEKYYFHVPGHKI